MNINFEAIPTTLSKLLLFGEQMWDFHSSLMLYVQYYKHHDEWKILRRNYGLIFLPKV